MILRSLLIVATPYVLYMYSTFLAGKSRTTRTCYIPHIDESCPSVMSQTSCHTHHVTHTSCHTHRPWAMSHVTQTKLLILHSLWASHEPHTCILVSHVTHEYVMSHTRAQRYESCHTHKDPNMGRLQLVGSLKSYFSFAKEPYKRDNTLHKRPVILRSLLIVATP